MLRGTYPPSTNLRLLETKKIRSSTAKSPNTAKVLSQCHRQTYRLTKIMATAFPARICFKLASKAESRLVLGDGDAEQLLSGGDFLFTVGGTPIRGQAPTLVDGDAAEVAEWIHSQVRPTYETAIAKASARTTPVAPAEPAPTA